MWRLMFREAMRRGRALVVTCSHPQLADFASCIALMWRTQVVLMKIKVSWARLW